MRAAERRSRQRERTDALGRLARREGEAVVVTVVAAFTVVWSNGCAMQQQVEQQLSTPAPINCRTAPGDLRVLQAEKANVVQRMAEGASAIAPAGIVLGILTGTETTKLQVATGEHNQMIDQRIMQIEQTCGIQ